MSLRLQPQTTVTSLQALGVNRSPREILQSVGEFHRCVWCTVVGGKGVGKSSVVRRLVGGAAPGVRCLNESAEESQWRFVLVGDGGRWDVGDGGGGGGRRGVWGNPGGAT